MAGMSAAQLRGWIEYYEYEPFGEERADLRTAIVACVVANANRSRNQKPFKVNDFMPKFGPKQPQTWQQQKAMFNPFKQHHNTQVRKRG